MKNIHKLTISALLVAATILAGIMLFVSRSTLPSGTVGREVNASRSTPSERRVSPVEEKPTSLSGQNEARNDRLPVKKASENGSAALILNSEKSLVAEMEGAQGVDVRASTALMMGNKFDDFMERLSQESSGAPLARDITDLYARAAGEANLGVDNAVSIKIACGMVVCGVSATAPTKDAFETWFKAFVENQTARPHAAGRYDRVLENGSVEYRILFSSDPQKDQVIAPVQ